METPAPVDDAPMSQYARDRLQDGDLHLFRAGACHIFAAVLMEKFPDEGYVLRRISTQGTPLTTHAALHVVAAKDKFIVDASGIKRNADYEKWVRAERHDFSTRNHCPALPPILRWRKTTADELLTPFETGGYGESLNRWGLEVGSEYISIARERAQKLIESFPAWYRLSLLTSGVSTSAVKS